MTAPVLIMAGGTGGHIFPGLAVAQVLRERGVPVAWMGAAGAMETRLVPAAGIDLHLLDIGGLRGKSLATLLTAPWRLLRALARASAILGRIKPRCVISFGGYAAGPGGLAAALRRVPLLVHEQNRVAGATNRILARRARRVMAGFPDVLAGAQWLGNPVRPEISALPAPDQRMTGRSGPARLLVVGGSLGAAVFNRMLPPALALMPPEQRPQVRHQCGRDQEQVTRQAYEQAGVQADVSAFIDDMAQAYAWADLALCRAGALTVAELASAGLASVLVPFPHAVDDHQTANARFLVEHEAALLLPQTELTADSLAATLGQILQPPGRVLAMAQAARACARPDAAERVADACLEVAR